MKLAEIDKEITRAKIAIENSKSDKLKRDYGKHLRKLERIKASYERSFRYATKW